MLTYKLEIGAATYYADRIMPPLSVQKALCNYGELTIGNVCSKTLNVTIIPGNTIINRRAQVKLYSSSTEGTPEWTPRGTFYIDTRRKGINTLSLVCYDAVLMMSNTFIQNNIPAEWPISMRAAIQHICTQLGIEAENINDISDTFMIPYTNTLTMRDVASRIANAHCGNFIINDANKLQLISIVGTDIGTHTPTYKNFKILADPYKFAKVIMFYDEQDYYGSLIEDELQTHLDAELPHKMLIDDTLHDYGFIQEGVYLKFIVAGTGSYNEFITTNEYATQEIATNVYNIIKNYTHRPYEIINAVFDNNTILEVGDKFQINNTDYIFFEGRINYGNVISYDMTAPYDHEMIHEYPVTRQYMKAIQRKVSLGTNYYGTTIDRDNGLTIEREDGLSKVIMNSESMKWQVDKGAGLADRLYFDAVAGDLKYNGSLEIQQDNNKAKTIINASETAIYGATGAGGALEKNFYVDATGKIVAKNMNLAGAITWGAESSPVKVQYSINGSTSWHDTFAAGDAFARYSYDGGTTYTGAVKIVGTDGANGTSTYTYIRYSVNSNGNPMVATPTSLTKYIGICVSTSSTAPSTYTSYTWSKYQGDDASVPGYIKSTYIDMSSVTSPYVIAGSLQGSNFVHYPPAPDSPLSYSGSAVKWDTYWGSNAFVKGTGVLTGLAVGSVVNVGSTAYGMNYAYRATILNFREPEGAIVTYPTQICNLDIAYVGMIPNSAPAYISLANQTTLGEPFTLYNVPITNHTNLSGYASNKIGGIKYTAGQFVLFTENDTTMKIQSDGALEIGSDSIVMKLVSNSAIVFQWGSQIYSMTQAASVGGSAVFTRLL